MSQATYTDNEGRSFNVHLTINVMRDVREQTGFSFGEAGKDGMEPFYEMLDDYEKLGEVLYWCIKPQLVNRELKRDDFVEAFVGDAIDRGREALWDAFAFFCPAQKREMLLMVKQAAMAQEKQIMTKISEACSTSATESLQSSESTPDPIASGS